MPDRSQNSFPKSARLRKLSEFENVYHAKFVVSDQTLVVYASRSGLSQTRLGLSIGKVVGSAPLRNRWKRLIREAFRLNRARWPAGIDVIVRPRKGAVADLAMVQASLREMFSRIERRLSAKGIRPLDSNDGEHSDRPSNRKRRP